MLIHRQTAFQQGIAVAIIAILRYLQLKRPSVEGDSPTACINEIGNSIKSTHIVINNDTAGVETRTDTVIEHNGNVRVYKLLEMFIATSVLSLRDDDATHFLAMKHLADACLALVLFVTQCHHNIIPARDSRLLYACENTREVVVRELWYDDSNNS